MAHDDVSGDANAGKKKSKHQWWLIGAVVPIVVALIGALTGLFGSGGGESATPASVTNYHNEGSGTMVVGDATFTTINQITQQIEKQGGAIPPELLERLRKVERLLAAKDYRNAIPILTELQSEAPVPGIAENLRLAKQRATAKESERPLDKASPTRVSKQPGLSRDAPAVAPGTGRIRILVRRASGFAEVDVRLYRERVWDEAGATKSKWDGQGWKSLEKGLQSFEVEPGKYYLTLQANSLTSTDAFVIKDGETRDFAFDLSTVRISATQEKGYVNADAYLYRWEEWDEAGEKKSKWSSVHSWSLVKGKRTLHVFPGTYYIWLKTNNGVYSEHFELVGTHTADFEFEISTIEVTAAQERGYVDGDVYLYQFREWMEAGERKSKWEKISSWSLHEGRRTLHVSPGRFYLGLKTGTWITTPEFTLKGTETRTFPFEVATIAVSAKQARGYVRGSATLFQKAEDDTWAKIDYWKLRNGECKLHVSPGHYYVSLKTDNWRATEAFELKGKQAIMLPFDVATLNVAATKANGIASGTVTLFEKDGKGEWSKVDYWRLKQGKCRLHVSPGSFRAVLAADNKSLTEEFTLEKREVRTLTFEFK